MCKSDGEKIGGDINVTTLFGSNWSRVFFETAILKKFTEINLLVSNQCYHKKKFDHEYLIGSLTYKDPIKHP